MTVTAILIIIVLIALNGLFVAAEFAIVGAPRAAIERMARRGNFVAGAVRRILNDPRQQDRFIATAQLGITLSSLGLGMYGEHQLAEWLAGHLERLGAGRWIAAHSLATVIAVAALTYLHIVFGEMVPKTVALQKAQVAALWVTPPIRAVQVLLYPLVFALDGIGRGLLRLAGVRREAGGTEHYRRPEELAYLVRETAAGGMLRVGPAQVVQELFELGELTAAEVMVPRVRVTALPRDATRDDIRDALQEAPHTRYPVYEETVDRVIGVVHVKDLLSVLVEGGSLDAMVRPVPFVPETVLVDHILASMAAARSQLVVVLDEHGGTAGIVTVEDLFEEVVGEFGEDPGEQPETFRDDAGRLHARGSARLMDVGPALGVNLEHDDVDTIGGLVFAVLGRLPRVGDVAEYRGIRCEVIAMDRRRVAEVLIHAATGESQPQ